MHDNDIIETIDRSTVIPLPEDRALSPSEQAALWSDSVPEALRMSCTDKGTQTRVGKPGNRAEEEDSQARHLAMRRIEHDCAERWGWLLNRLYWDSSYRGVRNPKEYRLPDCCRPGSKLAPRSALDKLRRTWYPPPTFTVKALEDTMGKVPK